MYINNSINQIALAKAKQPLTQEILKYLFNYDPLTGSFTYLHRTSSANWKGKKVERAYKARYRQIQIGGIFYLTARLAVLYMEGYFPEEVDHIDGNIDNETWANLRTVTKTQNQWNKKIQSNNTSGVKGVTWMGNPTNSNPRQQWNASIRYGEGKRLIKSFSVAKYGSKELALQEAELWITAMRDSLHKEYARHR